MKLLNNKLKVNEASNVLLLHADEAMSEKLKAMPGKLFLIGSKRKYSHIIYFVKYKNDLELQFNELLKFMSEETILVACYPKGKAKFNTDLSRDKGWDIVTNSKQLRWVNLISIDENWSAFVLRMKTQKENFEGLFDRKEKDESYYNTEKKEVYLPIEFTLELERNEDAKLFFNSLAYSHRREYVGYIVGAKKTETKLSRIQKVVQRLVEKKKNLTVK